MPVHLITREAIDVYFAKLAPGGLLVVNIANRYLDFRPVLANVAEETGRRALHREDPEADLRVWKFASRWVVLARDQADFGKLSGFRRPAFSRSIYERDSGLAWGPPPARSSVGVWSDDYSNPLSVFDWEVSLGR